MSVSRRGASARLCGVVIAIALVALGPRATLGQQPDSFYSELERDGRAALALGESAEASRVLRIACFGMLDAPERLGACLVRLGLAQAAAADGEGFAQTFRRLQTVEEKFAVWTRLSLDADERAAFEKVAAQRIPPALLRSQPAFAYLAPPPVAVAERGAKPGKREKPPAEVKPSKTKTAPNPAPAPAVQPQLEAAPVPAPAPAQPAAWTDAEREALARARSLTQAAAGFDAIEGALAEVKPVADRHPDDIDSQRLVAVLAYRASRWDLCATAFRSAPPPESEPLMRFYMAVCLYETGDAAGAAEQVRGSAAQLARTPFVDRYLKLILGPGAVVP